MVRRSMRDVHRRRDQVFSYILDFGEISVSELAKRLQVSDLTIRRDLDFFESKHLVERFYGGVRLLNETKAMSASQQVERIKRALAKKAAEYVNSGDIIFLNTSSTILYMISYLKGKEVTVVTNNGMAIRTNNDPAINIILTGGEVRIPKNAMVGDYAIQMLDTIRSTQSFLGCSGFSSSRGMSTSVHSEVSVNQKMLQQTNGPRFIVANSAKIEHDASFIVASVSDISGLITDDKLSKDTVEKLLKIPNFELILVDTYGLNLK